MDEEDDQVIRVQQFWACIDADDDPHNQVTPDEEIYA